MQAWGTALARTVREDSTRPNPHPNPNPSPKPNPSPNPSPNTNPDPNPDPNRNQVREDSTRAAVPLDPPSEAQAPRAAQASA